MYITIWLYKSGTESFRYNENNIEIMFGDNIMNLKKESIKTHIHKYDLMINNNKNIRLQSIIDKYKKSDLYPKYYSEKFKIIRYSDFYDKTIN
jgi:hypothetical protein